LRDVDGYCHSLPVLWKKVQHIFPKVLDIFFEKWLSRKKRGGNMETKVKNWNADPGPAPNPYADPDMVWATPAELADIRRKRRMRAGVPPRFLAADLDSWDSSVYQGQGYAAEVCRFYLEKFPELRRSGSGMVFFGNAGTGKTHLACALVNMLTDRGVDAHYVKYPSVLNRLRRCYSPRAFGPDERVETREGMISELADYDLLVMDEVAAVSGAADEIGLLYDIIDGRYECSRPTIICSNLNRDALIRLLSERLVDRLADQRGAFVPFDWPSVRG
jgi:DNA replication protein DnaC